MLAVAFAALALTSSGATTAVSAASASASYRHHEHWERTHELTSDHSMTLTVALKQRNLDQLKALVDDVSDPQRKATYGKYRTIDQIADLVAPTEHDIAAVVRYFRSIGASAAHLGRSRDYLTVTINADMLSRALRKPFHAYQHRRSRRVVHRTAMLTGGRAAVDLLPRDVARYIDVLTGVNDFPDSARERSGRAFSIDEKKMKKKTMSTKDTMTTDLPCKNPAPEIQGRVFGGADEVAPVFVVHCHDGSIAKVSPSAPPSCADGVVLDQISVTAVDMVTGHVAKGTATAAELVCTTRTCSLPEPVKLARAYARVNLTVAAHWAGGETSVGPYPASGFSASSQVYPQTILEAYQVAVGTRGTHPANSQAVTAFEEQYIDVDGDLMTFFDLMGLPRMYPTIHGKNDPTKPGGESTLDIQTIMSVGAGVPTTFWSCSGPGPAKPPGRGAYILEWAIEVAATTHAPLVTSISYGDTEIGFYNKFGNFKYVKRTNAELMKMAARGLTVIAGSGDGGVSNVGEAGNDISPAIATCEPFEPFFPSNSAYVTSLSSTFFTTNALPVCGVKSHANNPAECDMVGELPVGLSQGMFWTTGGGFSNMTSNPTPSWQQPALKSYLSTLRQRKAMPPASDFNVHGRAYPDIAVVGHNVMLVTGGKLGPADGTSASGPIFAGLISLMNDARLHANQPTMGCLNHFLYQSHASTPQAFHDVVMGSNKDGDFSPRCAQHKYASDCPAGFDAVPGYDAVTGLGSVNMEVLTALALKAGAPNVE